MIPKKPAPDLIRDHAQRGSPMRAIARLLPLLVLLLTAPALAEGPHRLALQISDNDAEKMNAVLSIAANVSKYYSEKGEEVEIQIVAFNAGLHMLRQDTSPVKARLASFAKGMPNVTFKVCQNTIDSMARHEGKPIPIIEPADQRDRRRGHADRAWRKGLDHRAALRGRNVRP
jgi:uncharacterized protein